MKNNEKTAPTVVYRCRDKGLCMLLLLHAIIACMLHLVSMLCGISITMYILPHSTENVFNPVSLVFTVYNNT